MAVQDRYGKDILQFRESVSESPKPSLEVHRCWTDLGRLKTDLGRILNIPKDRCINLQKIFSRWKDVVRILGILGMRLGQVFDIS